MADILIADDNPHVQHMAEAVLAPEGHRVSGVSDGKAALRRIRDDKPDLVLLDMKMPRADGPEVCRDIRADRGLADLRVAMLAGPLDPLDREGARAQGFDAVLQKPLDAETLRNTVHELLGGCREDDAEAPAAALSVDPLTHLVEETLAAKPERLAEDEIRKVVEEALAAAAPAMVERIAMQVSRKLKEI